MKKLRETNTISNSDRVLTGIVDSGGSASAEEIAKIFKLKNASVSSALWSLKKMGYVERSGFGKWQLTPYPEAKRAADRAINKIAMDDNKGIVNEKGSGTVRVDPTLAWQAECRKNEELKVEINQLNLEVKLANQEKAAAIESQKETEQQVETLKKSVEAWQGWYRDLAMRNNQTV